MMTNTHAVSPIQPYTHLTPIHSPCDHDDFNILPFSHDDLHSAYFAYAIKSPLWNPHLHAHNFTATRAHIHLLLLLLRYRM